jgi:NADPH-dependent glutamate synthase beta subunit-like oxidoreductase
MLLVLFANALVTKSSLLLKSNQDLNSDDMSRQIRHRAREEEDTAIIGAGISGLTAAILLARAGRTVTVFEQSSEVGGRARTTKIGDFYFNQGPHALYLS